MSASSGAEVIVVGSGPSGLAAAFRLQEAGHRVRILEQSNRAGSTLMSEIRGGFLLDRGAFFIPTSHTNMLRLAHDAGISGELRPGGDIFAVARSGELHLLDGAHIVKSFRTTRLLSPGAKLRAARLVPEVARARSAGFDKIEGVGRYDTENLSAWARRTQDPEIAEFLIESAVRSMYAAEAENLSRVEFLGVIALFGGAKLVAFRDGMAGYSRRLAERFEITFGARVTAVEPRSEGVEVTWEGSSGEQVERVAGCIVAVPARVAVRMLPQLDPWRRDYLARVPAGRLLIVHAGVAPRPPLTATYTMIPRSEHAFLAGIVSDHHKAAGRAPEGKGLLTLACTTEWSEEHYADDDDAIATAAIVAAGRFLPGLGDTVEFTAVSRWAQQYPPVGHYAGLAEFQYRSRKFDDAVQLCGEYMATPHISTATAAGERAAAALIPYLHQEVVDGRRAYT